VKNSKRLFIHYLFTILAACVGVICQHSVLNAEPYHIKDTIEIRSEISDVNAGSAIPAVINWIVVPEADESGSIRLSFLVAGGDSSVCQMSLTGTETHITWTDAARIPRIYHQNNLLVVPGSMMPCDILPVDNTNSKQLNKTFEIKRRVGGQTFVNLLQVDFYPVAASDAVANGWVTASQNLIGPLTMIRVMDLKKEVMIVQQLWSAGDTWWLYEESLTRQSWRGK